MKRSKRFTLQVWTLVQHSAFVVTGNPQFQFAVQEALVNTEAERRRVIESGGLIYEGGAGAYGDASERAYAENYPPHLHGFIPHVEGKFSKKKIDGSPIYIPAREGA